MSWAPRSPTTVACCPAAVRSRVSPIASPAPVHGDLASGSGRRPSTSRWAPRQTRFEGEDPQVLGAVLQGRRGGEHGDRTGGGHPSTWRDLIDDIGLQAGGLQVVARYRSRPDRRVHALQSAGDRLTRAFDNVVSRSTRKTSRDTAPPAVRTAVWTCAFRRGRGSSAPPDARRHVRTYRRSS